MEQIFGGGFFWTVLIGFLAGVVARLLTPGSTPLGCLMTIVLGIAGAVVARLIGQFLGWYQPGEPAGFLAAVLGAIALLVAYRLFSRK